MRKIYRFNEDREGFGKKLKELMNESNFSIESFASETNYTVDMVKKLRRGERVPVIEQINNIAKILNVSMQELYMPNSIYGKEFSEEMTSFLRGSTAIKNYDVIFVEEIKGYAEYLFQKLLFSFLSDKEQANLKTIFSCYEITDYGKEKIGLKGIDFEKFYFGVKDYISKNYGKDLPYRIDEALSKEIYYDFEKMVIFKEKGENVL